MYFVINRDNFCDDCDNIRQFINIFNYSYLVDVYQQNIGDVLSYLSVFPTCQFFFNFSVMKLLMELPTVTIFRDFGTFTRLFVLIDFYF